MKWAKKKKERKGKADGEAPAKHATQFAFIEGDNDTDT